MGWPSSPICEVRGWLQAHLSSGLLHGCCWQGFQFSTRLPMQGRAGRERWRMGTVGKPRSFKTKEWLLWMPGSLHPDTDPCLPSSTSLLCCVVLMEHSGPVLRGPQTISWHKIFLGVTPAPGRAALLPPLFCVSGSGELSLQCLASFLICGRQCWGRGERGLQAPMHTSGG